MEMTRDGLLAFLREKPRHERIAALRSLYRLSQAGLANVAGVARGTVSTWEAPVHDLEDGRGHEPGKIARQRMSAFFGLPAYVFSDDWGENTRADNKIAEPRPVPIAPKPAAIKPPAAGVKRIRG